MNTFHPEQDGGRAEHGLTRRDVRAVEAQGAPAPGAPALGGFPGYAGTPAGAPSVTAAPVAPSVPPVPPVAGPLPPSLAPQPPGAVTFPPAPLAQPSYVAAPTGQRPQAQAGQPATPAYAAAAPPQGAPVQAPAPAAARTPVAGPPAPPSAPTPASPPAQRGPQPRERNARIGMTQLPGEGDLDLDSALKKMIEMGASDLHVTVGAPPNVRLDGRLQPLEGFPALVPDSVQRTLYSILTQKQREVFEANLELDFAYAVRGVARFRVNMYQQRDSLGAAFRVIPYEIKPLEALGVPPVVANFANLPRGLVLVTGPTGSGKSTTLASIIDLANRTRSDHIMTVEDPIEFLHRHKKSLINQREVGADTHSFANALKHVLRQDPDIILVGEMRDLETIHVALTAAETGHLVFATLHTQDAAQTIDRIIDVFPSHQQAQVRTQLATAIQGVVCQTLTKRADGPGRAVATEVMIATPAIRNLIREGKTHQIYSAMQAGAQMGMHTMDQHLAELVKIGRITYEQGAEKCHHIADFNRLTGRLGDGGGGTSLGAMSGGDPLGAVTLGVNKFGSAS
ncbi:type IV pilus twitching motility protein PilT [Actinotalea sp. AC32]|nr:type IV pilus twitching motility protein PilT [Actinotalea sp. AC32]